MAPNDRMGIMVRGKGKGTLGKINNGAMGKVRRDVRAITS